jgi:hypothetical protein
MTYARLLALLVASSLSLGAPARAEDPPSPEGREVTHGSAELRALIATPAAERTGVETALVFANVGANEFRVLCAAYDAEGALVGHAWTRIPPRGLRFLLASDLSAGAPFAGRAECAAIGRVVPSALLLTPGGVMGVASQHFLGARGDFMLFALAASD